MTMQPSERRAAPNGPPTPQELGELEEWLEAHPAVERARAWTYRDDPRFVEIEIEHTGGTVRRQVTTTSSVIREAAAEGKEGFDRIIGRWIP